MEIIRGNGGFSGCLTFLLIVLVIMAGAGTWLYFQWSDIKELGTDKLQNIIIQADKLQELDISNVEDLEDLNVEKLKEINPTLLKIYRMVPEDMMVQLQKISNGSSSDRDLADTDSKDTTSQKKELAKTESELLPASIPASPDSLKLVDYQEFGEIPDFILPEIKGKFINKNSIMLEYEAEFPERELEELESLKEVPDGASESQIKENREELEKVYNIKSVMEDYRKKLLQKGWKVSGEKENQDYAFLFEHEDDGYFLILGLENYLYTPRL